MPRAARFPREWPELHALLVAIPNVGGELPIASDLLPHDHVLTDQSLRLLALCHQRERPDLASRLVAERSHIQRRKFHIANSFARFRPKRLNVATAFRHLAAGWKEKGVLGVHSRDCREITFVERTDKRIVEFIDRSFVLSRR